MAEARGETATAFREFGTRLSKLEEAIVRTNEITILKLDHISENVDGVSDQLKALNGQVRQHETRITLMEQFCKEQVKPALEALMNVRLELARWGLFGGGIGIVAAVGFGIGKLAAWW